jgi:translation initiation factor IF-1
VPRADVIEIEGVVMEALPNGTYRVGLANGHRLTGFLGRLARRQKLQFAAGERVRLELSPCDLSEGRIVVSTGDGKTI